MMKTKELMMSSSKSIVALSVIALLTSIPAYAQIVNLDAVTDASDSPQVLSLEAGEYHVQPIGTLDGGMYDAWNYRYGEEGKWRSRYSISSDELGEIPDIGGRLNFATLEEAMANAASYSFVLTAPGDVSFFLADGDLGYEYAADNVGGMSLLVTPEPTTIALLGIGALISRKRRA